MKTQTLKFSHPDKTWTTGEQADQELNIDINTIMSGEDASHLSYNISVYESSSNATFELDNDNNLIVTRVWALDEDYFNHKSNIAEVETYINAELEKMGWCITDEVM